jgi:hypothetical protein
MDLDTIQTLVRSVLKIGAGYLAAKGIADSATLEVTAAGIVGGIAIIWGIMHRTPATPAK